MVIQPQNFKLFKSTFELNGFCVHHQPFATHFLLVGFKFYHWVGFVCLSVCLFVLKGDWSMIYYLSFFMYEEISLLHLHLFLGQTFSFLLRRFCFIPFLQWMLLWKSLRPIWFSLLGGFSFPESWGSLSLSEMFNYVIGYLSMTIIFLGINEVL